MKKDIKVILGHNSFFGVDHLSAKSGDLKDKKFEDSNSISDILEYCNQFGINSMMMSTHPRASVVSKIIRENVNLQHWDIMPLLPYVQKYVRQSNEVGLNNLILDLIKKTSVKDKFEMLIKGSKGIFTKNLDDLISVLIDIEMLPFKGNKTSVIFLHDALVDLAIGLGASELLKNFKEHVEKKYNSKAGFITKNISTFVKEVEKYKWNDYVLMASFNKTGFFVNPSIEDAENAVKNLNVDFIPMSVLASGAIKPQEAFEYISRFENITSIILGMTNKKHIEENINSLNKIKNEKISD